MQTFRNLLELNNSAGGLRNVHCLNDSVLQRNNICFLKKGTPFVLQFLKQNLSAFRETSHDCNRIHGEWGLRCIS